MAPRIGGEYNEKQETGEMPSIDEKTSLSQSVHLRDFIHTRFLFQSTQHVQPVYHSSSWRSRRDASLSIIHIIYFISQETLHSFCREWRIGRKVCIPGDGFAGVRKAMDTLSGVPRNFFLGGVNKFSWGQRERGSGGGSPLVRGSGGSCNLVQEISFHIVKFS